MEANYFRFRYLVMKVFFMIEQEVVYEDEVEVGVWK
jgi:hypothetical protein